MLEGIEEGKEESKIDIARSMLEDNISLENISKYTGLSIEKINKL